MNEHKFWATEIYKQIRKSPLNRDIVYQSRGTKQYATNQQDSRKIAVQNIGKFMKLIK